MAKNLNRLLSDKNLTITSVCRKIGMNKSTLHNYCNGVVPRNLTKLQELANLLGVTLNELVSEKMEIERELKGKKDEKYEITIKRLE